MPEHTLKSRYEGDHNARRDIIDTARICAALTKPWILPPEDQQPNDSLPDNYQSVGSRGITNLEGRMMLALWPHGVPWFQHKLSERIRQEGSPEEIQFIEQELFLRDITIQSILESAGSDDPQGRRRRGFRTGKRMAISQVLITGDVLEQILPDYRIRVFRRDQYVTKRDSAGDVLFHGIVERIDPLALNDVQLARANLNPAELADKPVFDRMVDLYTYTDWHPRSKAWVITQEVNEKSIGEATEERVSQFISTAFELVPGENYGRGFIELNKGELVSLNELEERILDFAAMSSKFFPCIDRSSEIRADDLTRKTGTVLEGANVQGGQVQDIAFLQTQKLADFQIVDATVQRKRNDLGAAMLLLSDSVRQSERTTAFEIQKTVIDELQGALGGMYAPIADEQQVPTLQRIVWQMERDKLLAPLPKAAVKVDMLTGIAALSRAAQAQNLLSFAQVVASLGDEALNRIDVSVLTDVLARHQLINEPGLIKSDEQLEQERQRAQQDLAVQQANEQAIKSAGAIAETAVAGQ